MQKSISIEEYNKKMGRIIKKGRPVSDTLIEMLDEASKYSIKRKLTKRVK